MNKQAVYHKAKSNYCYAYTNTEVHIRLRVARGDCDKVTIIYGDKYKWHDAQRSFMQLEYSDANYDYYIAKVSEDSKRLSYYFELLNSGTTYIYTEYGFLENFDKGDEHFFIFHYPYINNEDVHKVPEWVKDAVFYQIFPDRFFIGDNREKTNELVDWDSMPKGDSFYGGDIKGIMEKLPYLDRLGITAIYLTPIFKSTSNHKYNTNDYMELDPDFGSKEDLKQLVEEAHKLGMKIVLDAVFNHSGEEFFAFKDLLEKQEKSEYKDWFHVKEFPIDYDYLVKRIKEKGWKDWYIDEESGKEILPYHTFAHVPNMPKLNTENEALTEYLLEVGRYWIKEFDIDGWRLDVANEVSHDFWRRFRKAVKEVKEDAYIVGEIWHDSTPWLQGDQYDAVMNYALTYVSIKYFAKGQMNPREFRENLANILVRYSWQVNEVMLNLLDSHDTARFINKSSLEIKRLKLAELFMMTFVGAPMIYYGTEVGMIGEDDPDCRRGMIWDEEKWDNDLLEYMRRLIKIRREKKVLRRGDVKLIDEDKLVVFERVLDDKAILVVINGSDEAVDYKLPEKYRGKAELVRGIKLESEVKLEGLSGMIIEA